MLRIFLNICTVICFVSKQIAQLKRFSKIVIRQQESGLKWEIKIFITSLY